MRKADPHTVGCNNHVGLKGALPVWPCCLICRCSCDAAAQVRQSGQHRPPCGPRAARLPASAARDVGAGARTERPDVWDAAQRTRDRTWAHSRGRKSRSGTEPVQSQRLWRDGAEDRGTERRDGSGRRVFSGVTDTRTGRDLLLNHFGDGLNKKKKLNFLASECYLKF